MIDFYDISGCYILRPWSYSIWEAIQDFLDGQIKTLGVQNCYFPMFVSEARLNAEKDHVEGFAPEVAWVTKSGDGELNEPIAIRPTSETIMYPAFANWIHSHRDLPLKLNQWNNVVRWEFKHPTPFLRTREFLWQEGHTAYDNYEDAEKEVYEILELYAGVYEHLLAIPVVRGTKTRAETFPGADYTTTVEAFIPATGRAIQGATSHHLGRNFSKMFDISFQDPADATGKTRAFAYQNSWGLTTRTIGVMIMVHGDNRGLQLPPEVAAHQVVIVPVGLKASTTDEERAAVGEACMQYYMSLKQAGVRVKLDDTTAKTPGWKFSYWEMKGVPLRIELGPMDIKKGGFMMAKRNVEPKKGSKILGKQATMVEEVKKTLADIQTEMYAKALSDRDEKLAAIDDWAQFSPELNKGKLVLIPFCGAKECEEAIKDKSKEESLDAEVEGGLTMGAKSLCVPHEPKYNTSCPATCVFPGCDTKTWEVKGKPTRTLFGRSY